MTSPFRRDNAAYPALLAATLSLSALIAAGCTPQQPAAEAGASPAPAASVDAAASPAAADASASPSAEVAGPPPPPGPPGGAAAGGGFDKSPFKAKGPAVTTKSGLKYETMTEGKGKQATEADTVLVHYTGTLKDGTVFDSSRERGEAAEFPLSGVVPGFREGIAGMKEGGRRRLTLTPELGYGAQGTPGGPIPPNATLTFDVELIKVQ